jgi:hypothetical protein
VFIPHTSAAESVAELRRLGFLEPAAA